MSDTKTVSGNIVHIQDKGAPSVVSVIADITPKQSGSGTPSPSNIRQISGWESVSVNVTGKNLFDKSVMAKNWYITGSNTIGNGGTCLLFSVPIGVTFTVSGTNGGRNRLLASDKPYNELVVGDTLTSLSNTNLPLQLTSQYRTYIYYCETSFNQAIADSIQVELGSTATTYEPYNGTTTAVNLGRTVYGGTLDVVSGVLTVDRAIVDLGTLDWTKYNVAEGTLYRASINTIKRTNSPADVPNIVCSHYPVKPQNERAEKTMSQPTNNSAVDIIDSTYTDAATFKTAMDGVQLVYELANPQTYTLTGQNVNLLKDCYVWANSGDISVTYETYLINGLFHKIWINGVKMFAPNDFTLERSDVYAGEITTCTGKTIADRIGWKYADMSLNWDYLPQEYLETILNLSGVFTITFENEEGVQFTEQCIRKGSTMTGTRFTDNNGNMMWKGVQFDISFINVHN